MIVNLHVTSDCNLRCDYCYASPTRAEHMELETALAARELAAREARDIMGKEGAVSEPLSHDEIQRILHLGIEGKEWVAIIQFRDSRVSYGGRSSRQTTAVTALQALSQNLQQYIAWLRTQGALSHRFCTDEQARRARIRATNLDAPPVLSNASGL